MLSLLFVIELVFHELRNDVQCVLNRNFNSFFFITSSNSFINFYDSAYAQQANLKDPDILFLTINGLILGLGVIVGITFGTRKLTKRLPIRILFGLTLGLGAYVSIALIGNAIMIFQEVGYISTTPYIHDPSTT